MAKSAKLIKKLFQEFVCLMPYAALKNTKVISKDLKNQKLVRLRILEQYTPVEFLQTPLKRCRDEQDAVKKEPRTASAVKEPQIYRNISIYQSFHPYTLGPINSISFHNGRFYDHLSLKKQSVGLRTKIKCNCLRSKCQAKYCDCYANGLRCNPECGCTDCSNFNRHPSQIQIPEKFCKCQKSQCQKNYCECFKRGESCSSKCHCVDCRNESGIVCKN